MCHRHYAAVILTVNEEMRVAEGVSWKCTVLTTSTDVDAACLINAQLGGNHTQQPRLTPQNHQLALNGRSAVIMAGRHGKQNKKKIKKSLLSHGFRLMKQLCSTSVLSLHYSIQHEVPYFLR